MTNHRAQSTINSAAHRATVAPVCAQFRFVFSFFSFSAANGAGGAMV
ncbi:MAG TPA: hypothetical protein VNN73_09140 [Blastocatellia bacterium]|nr:hypothetical protein [Blastocatellia bacterium]